MAPGEQRRGVQRRRCAPSVEPCDSARKCRNIFRLRRFTGRWRGDVRNGGERIVCSNDPQRVGGFAGARRDACCCWFGEGADLAIVATRWGLYAGGAYEHQPSNLFLSAGFGVRNDFFGLDQRYDYEPTLGYEANAGHRDLLFRISRQRTRGSQGGLVEWAEGTAVGFTARRSVALSEGLRVEAALDLDKFAGGEAKTVFGSVRMDKSGWNKTLSVKATHRPGPYATLTAGAEIFVSADGDDAFAAGVRLDMHFPHQTAQWFPGVECPEEECRRHPWIGDGGKFWVNPNP